MLDLQSLVVANPAILLAILGGLGSYLQGARDGRIKRGVLNFITEIVLAIVVGLVVLYLGEWMAIPQSLVYVLILLFSNNSSDTLGFLKKVAQEMIAKKITGK